MAYGPSPTRVVRFSSGDAKRTPVGAQRGRTMNDKFKSQSFRIVMFLSMLASSSLVLMAGRRWS